MKYVFHALRMQWRCATQYRASFWMQTLAQLVLSGSELMEVLLLLGLFASERRCKWVENIEDVGR